VQQQRRLHRGIGRDRPELYRYGVKVVGGPHHRRAFVPEVSEIDPWRALRLAVD